MRSPTHETHPICLRGWDRMGHPPDAGEARASSVGAAKHPGICTHPHTGKTDVRHPRMDSQVSGRE